MIWRDGKATPGRLVGWDPLKDIARVVVEGEEVEVKLSMSLPLSTRACQEITAKPQMMTINQAQRLLRACHGVTLSQAAQPWVSAAYSGMLAALATYVGPQQPISRPSAPKPKPAVKSTPTPTIKETKKPNATKKPQKAGRSQSPPVHAPKTPYELRQIVEKERKQQIAEKEKAQQAAEFLALRAEQLLRRQKRQEHERRVLAADRRQHERERRVEQQRKQALETRRQKELQQAQELEKARLARARLERESDPRVVIGGGAVILKLRLSGEPGEGVLDCWLPERNEFQLQYSDRILFAPVPQLLRCNAHLCPFLLKHLHSLESGLLVNMLLGCLRSQHLTTTPEILDLLEQLRVKVQCLSPDVLHATARAEIDQQVAWRRQRCAEKYGYKSVTNQAEADAAIEALRQKAQRQPTDHRPIGVEVYRLREWAKDGTVDDQGRIVGTTHFNPFEYK